MSNPKEIRIAQYDYELPDERIAKFPVAERDKSKLLIYHDGKVSEAIFCNISHYLPAGSMMVFNNTRVIQARLHFHKSTGAQIELFLLEPVAPADYEQMFQTTGRCSWLCMVGNLKKWKEGALERSVMVGSHEVHLTAERHGERGTSHWIDFCWEAGGASVSFAEILEAMGELPIPPYLNRATQESDKQTYQTVYSKVKGSVAAPTAGLHFTERVLNEIDACGIERDEVTLHVGAGTFRPVKSERMAGHDMHTEYIVVHRHTIERLLAHNAETIAVGTTSVRTLESLYYMGLKLENSPLLEEEDLHVAQWEPYQTAEPMPINAVKALQNVLDWMDRRSTDVLHSSTQIIIVPGYKYKIVRMLVTNFHQPKSTLLLLVSAFVGGDWRTIYQYALDHDFRFLSYGDSSLLTLTVDSCS